MVVAHIALVFKDGWHGYRKIGSLAQTCHDLRVLEMTSFLGLSHLASSCSTNEEISLNGSIEPMESVKNRYDVFWSCGYPHQPSSDMLSSFNWLTRFTVESRLIQPSVFSFCYLRLIRNVRVRCSRQGSLSVSISHSHFSVPDLDPINALRPQLDRVGESHAPPSKTFRTGVC